MKSISLYEDKGTILNKTAPESKLFYILTAILVPALIGSRWAGIAFISCSVLLLLLGRVLKKTLPIIALSGFVLLTVVIIQGIFREENTVPVFSIGSVVFYREGLLFSLSIVINILNMLLGFCVMILTTKPSDLIENLMRRGFSPRFGYVFVSVFEIIPQMTETMETITDAQRSRGMETEGNLFNRIRAFIPLISPVVMSSLVNTRERALALEARGFNAQGKHTYLNEETKTEADIYLQGIMAAMIAAALIWRMIAWLM